MVNWQNDVYEARFIKDLEKRRAARRTFQSDSGDSYIEDDDESYRAMTKHTRTKHGIKSVTFLSA